MPGPIAAVAWSLFVYVVADAAWRIASQLVPEASVTVFLLAAALVGETIAAATVAWPGLVGCFGLPVVGPWLGLLHLMVRRLRLPPRTLAQVVARAVGGGEVAWWPVAAVVLTVCGTGLVALNQVRFTVQDADSMWYHLPMAAEYVRTGSIAPIDAIPLIARGYPGFRESILAFLSLPLGNEHLALLGVVEFPLLALAVYAVARSWGARGGLALAAGAYAVTTPIVLAALTTQGNDLALAIAFALSALFTSRWLAGAGRGDAVLAGLALGALAATKFSGPGYALAVVAVTAVQWGLRRCGGARGFASTTAAATLVAGPWYARNLLAFGNPFHPASIDFLGAHLFDGPLGPDYFEPTRLGWNLAPLLDSAHQFVDAHGPLVALIAIGPLLAAVGARCARVGWRTVLVPVVLPTVLLVAFLHHPFSVPGFDAHVHRYLIAWSCCTAAATVVGLTWLGPRLPVWDVALVACVAVGLFGATRFGALLLALAAAATAAIGFAPSRARLAAAGRRPPFLPFPAAALLLVLVPVAVALQQFRAGAQYDTDLGYRDAVSDRGWGPVCAFVHRNIAGKRVGIHGSIAFFPLLGEPFGNVVFVADDLQLRTRRKSAAEVADWAVANRLDYLVCCVPRTGRTGAREFEFGESIAAALVAAQPQRFASVFSSRGAAVLQLRD